MASQTRMEKEPKIEHRTHQLLLDAGMAVAEREGLAGLSVNRVVAEAGVAKGTFYVHFADREAFVDALHARFHDRVEAEVAAATSRTPVGPERTDDFSGRAGSVSMKGRTQRQEREQRCQPRHRRDPRPARTSRG